MAGAIARYEVLLTAGAEHDVESIHDFIAAADGAAHANRWLDRIMEVVESLSRLPERGNHPKELLALGIREYRQVAFKPYRAIYRVAGSQVIIHLVADGRRDMQSLLARRLLAA